MGGVIIFGDQNRHDIKKKTFLFMLHGMSNRDTSCTKNNTLIKNESND